MKYFEKQDFVISDAKFTYQNALFNGKGFMSWNHEEGFTIKLFVNSKEYERPKAQGFGAQKIIRENERQNIYLTIDGFKKAIVPSAYLGSRLDIYHNKTLSIKSYRLIFFESKLEKKTDFWHGEGLFKLTKSKHLFPDSIHKKIKIGNNRIKEGWSTGGILCENDNFGLTAWIEDEVYLHLRYNLRKSVYSQKFARYFPCGFQNAISFFTGTGVKRLRTEVNCRNSCPVEVNKMTEPEKMSLYQGLHTFQLFESSLVEKLSLFLTEGYVDKTKYIESYVCQRMISQLNEAEQQKTLTAQELLTSTILEASLRSLYNKPFNEGKKSKFDVSNYLKNNFLPDYADGKIWREVRKEVIKAFESIRHRNAHPDWLVTEDLVFSDERISDTLHDLRVMIKFYQMMILLLAGVDDVDPKLPEQIV